MTTTWTPGDLALITPDDHPRLVRIIARVPGGYRVEQVTGPWRGSTIDLHADKLGDPAGLAQAVEAVAQRAYQLRRDTYLA